MLCSCTAPAFLSQRRHMSVTEDHQSIIPRHCAVMMLLVDTLDLSHSTISEDKAFFGVWLQRAAWGHVVQYKFQREEEKKNKIQSHGFPIGFQKRSHSRGAIDHAAQQYNLFHLTSLSALQFICRRTFLAEEKKNETAMRLNIKIILLEIYGEFLRLQVELREN